MFWLYFVLLTFCSFKYGKCVVCYGDSFVNLCGYCVGGTTGLSETKGLDRCGVCGGNNSCVGCDGVVNSAYKKDLCGLCLKPISEQWNDCLVIGDIYPKSIDRALKNSIVAITIRGAGLISTNPAVSSTFSCSAVSEENQDDIPKIIDLSIEDEDLELLVEVGSSIGVYSISCSGVAGTTRMLVVNSLNWDTVAAYPNQLTVDSTYQFELEVKGERVGLYPVLCVIRCSESPTHIKTGKWMTQNTVRCREFTPRFAGWCEVGVAASSDAGEDKDSCGKFVKFSVMASPPHIISAEYDQDLGKLLIRFNVNIQLSAPCSKIFSQASLMSVDVSEDCHISGDLLAVSLRADHPLLPAVDIIMGNGIRRMGSNFSELSPECYPVSVPVSQRKVLPPNLSLQVPSVMCHGSEELRVASIGKQRLNYKWSVPPPSIPPGSQRENLVTWRNVRQLEKGLNNPQKHGYASIDAAELLPEKAYQIQVRGTNALGEETMVSSALVFSPNAKATVVVSAPPGVSSILAEVNLTMCSKPSGSLSFQWFLNENHIPGGGRMIFMGNLKPEIYNVTCIVSLHQSSEVLASGWVLTQVLPSEEKVLLSPANQVIGTMDSAIVQAYLPVGSSAVWRCFTPPPESQPCLAPGPRLERVDQLIPCNYPVLTVPPGLLPVGRYIWRLENLESTDAVIEVRAGQLPLVRVTPIPPHVNPRKALLLHGEAERLHVDCTMRWSTVFRLGFNYFNLDEDVGLGDPLRILYEDGDSAELPLIVPTSQGHWGGLMSEAWYLLRLVADCPEASGSVFADVPIVVNVPPTVAPITVTPTSGLALTTTFTVAGGSAYDIMGDYPLRFVWSVKVDGDDIPVATGSSSRAISLFLPPGEISVDLNVCDIHNTCTTVTSSEIVAVISPASMNTSSLEEIKNELSNLIIEGSIIDGIGKSVVALNTLASIKMDGNEQFTQISRAVEDAISIRTKDLIQGLQTEPLLAVTALDFLQDVSIVSKFLSPDNNVFNTLNLLKEALTNVPTHRTKRETDKAPQNVGSNHVERCTRLLNSTIETESKEEMNNVLNLTTNCLINICEAQGDIAIKISTQLVKLWVSEKLNRTKKGKLTPAFKDLPSVVITKLPGNAKCLSIVKLNTQLFKDTDLIGSAVYQIQFISSEKTPVTLSSGDTMFDIFLPNEFGNEKTVCMHNDLNLTEWKQSCSNIRKVGDSSIACKCRVTGYFALRRPPSFIQTTTETSTTSTTTTTTTSTITMTTTTMTTIEKTVSTTTPSTIDPASGSTLSLETTSPFDETIKISTSAREPAPSPSDSTTIHNIEKYVTTENIEFNNGVKVESVVREALQEKDTIGGGRFIIENNFNEVVGANQDVFRTSMATQIAKQLNVEDNDIYVTAKEGSIVVSVYFLTEMAPQNALSALGHLVELVKNEQLLLEYNGKQLDIPKQNLTLIITPDEASSKVYVLQTATFVVAGSAVAIIIFMVILATRGGQAPPDFVPRRGSRVEDSSPCYLDLHNDYSLDGSSESLAQFRRPSLWSEK